MTRCAREISPTGFYHIVLKGAGDMLIFENDEHRLYFIHAMRERLSRDSIKIIAWCLMDNHVHMLIDDPEVNIHHGMHGLCTAYARFFNSDSGHKGPVFNDRFQSFPILDDLQLLCCVRYIHDNPIKAGIATAQMYAWSSFRDYMANSFDATDTDLVLDMLGGVEGFYRDSTSSSPNPYFIKEGSFISDMDAREVASAVLAPYQLHEIKSLPKPLRDSLLVRLKDLKFRISQIERLTEVGRNVIQRAQSE